MIEVKNLFDIEGDGTMIDTSNFCEHNIKMRVWRQSSETRQAALDAKKQAIRDEVVFGKGLETSAESNKDVSRVGALRGLTNKISDMPSFSQGNSMQSVSARYESATIATS